MKTINLDTAIRRKLTDTSTRSQIIDLLNWSNSDVSRFLAGNQGVPLDKLDDLIAAIGYIPVEHNYLSAVQTLCVVGSQCECALAGKGACGIQNNR